MSDEHTHRLTVRNDLDDVAKASEWLHGIAQAHDVAPELVFRMDLCIAEAVTNIVSYAFADAGPHGIELELCFEAGWATLTITDAGRSFDPLAVPEPAQARSLDEAPIGGLGVHLIRHYVDECAYERRRERNVLSLRWRMPEGRGAR